MRKRSLVILTASFCIVFVAYAIRYSYGVILPEMLPSLGISKSEAGMIYSSFILTYTLLSPVLGLLADRTDIRVLLTSFSVILGIGTLLMAFSSSLIAASLSFALAGVGASACWSPVIALAQRWVSDKHRGKALAFINAGSSLGVVLSSMAIPPIVKVYSWRMGWAGLGTMAFFVAGMSFFLVRSNPLGEYGRQNARPGGDASKPVRRIYIKALGDARFWLIGLSYLLVGASIVIPYTFLTTYAVKELALPYEAAARLITIIATTAVLGMLVLGSLSDAIGRIRLMILCGALVSAGCWGMVYQQGLVTLGLSCVIFGVGYGAVWPLYAACASDYFPKESAGGIIGFWTLLLGIGSMLSPIIGGWVADVTGTLTWSFILAMATALVSMFLLLPVRKATL